MVRGRFRVRIVIQVSILVRIIIEKVQNISKSKNVTGIHLKTL